MNNIKIIKHYSIENFLLMNEEILLIRESFYNLMLGLAYGLRDKKIESSDPLYYSIEVNGKVAGCALRSNHDKPFIVTEISNELIDLLIKDLISNNIELAAIVGPEEPTTYFKDQWTNIKDLDFKLNIHLGVYECSQIIFPKLLTGELVEAALVDEVLVKKYLIGFWQDCFPNQVLVNENIEKLMSQLLKNKSLFFLKNTNNEIVSMAANSRSTLNSGTISLVYTPPEQRGFGYGSTVVALVSERIMKNGKKFTNLFTDLTNPTSNSIYQKIGYVKIGQNIHFDFINR